MQIAESLKRRLFEHEEGTRGGNIHPRAGNKVSADVDDRDSCWPRDAELRDGWKQKRAEFASLLCKGEGEGILESSCSRPRHGLALATVIALAMAK